MGEATATKERPILFGGPMVRAILRGEKTQTRRIVKPQPANGCRYEINGAMNAALHVSGQWGNHPTDPIRFVPPTPKSEDHRLPCPYGQPGDRLWVRETWATHFIWAGCSASEMETAFDEGTCLFYRADGDSPSAATGGCIAGQRERRWRPSIFMPRWASRLTLEITGVRVERLQDISEEGAAAEGVGPGYVPNSLGSTTCVGYRPMFASIWRKIHGPDSWAANPWVWVIDVRRIGEGS